MTQKQLNRKNASRSKVWLAMLTSPNSRTSLYIFFLNPAKVLNPVQFTNSNLPPAFSSYLNFRCFRAHVPSLTGSFWSDRCAMVIWQTTWVNFTAPSSCLIHGIGTLQPSIFMIKSSRARLHTQLYNWVRLLVNRSLNKRPKIIDGFG